MKCYGERKKHYGRAYVQKKRLRRGVTDEALKEAEGVRLTANQSAAAAQVYREVAAITCLMIDRISEIAALTPMSQEELGRRIGDIVSGKNRIIADPIERGRMFAFAQLIYDNDLQPDKAVRASD